jgi:hypothetical protein
MSDDIVERLRTAKGSVRHGPNYDGSYSLGLLNNLDLCHEAADEIKRLRADLTVVVGALRDMDLAIYADGCHIVNHAEFTADPDHLRRLLTEDQT